MNVTVFTPAKRIKELEELNQVQYATIKLLLKQLEDVNEKLKHVEHLLKFVSVYDINTK